MNVHFGSLLLCLKFWEISKFGNTQIFKTKEFQTKKVNELELVFCFIIFFLEKFWIFNFELIEEIEHFFFLFIQYLVMIAEYKYIKVTNFLFFYND